jgi:hypothetical protein
MSTTSGERTLGLAPARFAPWLAWGTAGLACGIVAVALAGGSFSTGIEPLCLLRRIAHLSCPTCGMTRALALLWVGDLRGALAYHPWAPALMLQLVAGWIWWGTSIARGSTRPDRWLPHAVALNAAALLVVWVIRLATGTLPPG